MDISIYGIAALLLWICWRIWTFTIIPILWPHEIPQLPYWIPVLGHALSLYRDIDGTLTQARHHFGDTGRTFFLTVVGQKIYFMTGASNVSAALKHPRVLDNGQPKRFLMSRFGISGETIRRLHQHHNHGSMFSEKPEALASRSLPGKSSFAVSEHSIRKQLLPGDHFSVMDVAVLKTMQKSLSLKGIMPQAIRHRNENSITVSLYELIRITMIQATAQGFFGPTMLKMEPDFIDHYYEFDDQAEVLLRKLPGLWKSLVESCMDTLRSSVCAYLAVAKENREEAAWLVPKLESELSLLGIPARDIAGLLIMVYWGMNANTWRLCFWVVAHLVHDTNLMSLIREETSAIIKSNESFATLSSELTSCRRLTALYYEVLRTVDSAISVRMSTGAFTSASGEVIPEGAMLVFAHRQLLLDKEIWGSDPYRVQPERFLKEPSLLKSKNYIPFGGGGSMCPGRFIAQSEIIGFIALFLHSFNVEVVGHNSFPRVDLQAGAGVGILGITAGDDVLLRLSHRGQDR